MTRTSTLTLYGAFCGVARKWTLSAFKMWDWSERRIPKSLNGPQQINRIVLTHDRATMPAFAYTRLENGESMPGVFVVNNRHLVRDVITEFSLIDECSEQHEWLGLVVFLPL